MPKVANHTLVFSNIPSCGDSTVNANDALSGLEAVSDFSQM